MSSEVHKLNLAMTSAKRKKCAVLLSATTARQLRKLALGWHGGERQHLASNILDERIRKLPASVSPDDLRLRYRTYHSLKNAGLLNSARSLEGMTFSELLQLKNFGVVSL